MKKEDIKRLIEILDELEEILQARDAPAHIEKLRDIYKELKEIKNRNPL